MVTAVQGDGKGSHEKLEIIPHFLFFFSFSVSFLFVIGTGTL